MARLPGSETFLGIIQCLPCGLRAVVCGTFLSGNNGGIVEEIDELSCLGGEQDLLLGALNDGCSVKIVSFLELLSGDVGELGFGDERLCLSADKLLLKGDELRGFGLFVFELLDLILNLW